MSLLPLLILFWFFIVIVVKSLEEELDLQPRKKIIYEQGTATFYCDTGMGPYRQVVWLLNGSLASGEDSNAAWQTWKTYGRNKLRAILFRNTPAMFNNTTIQCQIQNSDSISNIATLLVQGIPSMVSELAYSLQESGVNISWKAPFSLTVPPQAFPIITYCMEIRSKDVLHNTINTCHIRRTWYSLPRSYFEWIANVSVMARNSVGTGEANKLNFPSANLHPVKVLVYTGTEVMFQCSYTGPHSGRLVWMFNGTRLNHRVRNTQESFMSGHHVVKFIAVSSHNNANIRCVFLYRHNYNTTSNVAVLHVQGTLEVSLMTTVSGNVLNISWPEPFTYIISPNNTEENYHYCVLTRTEPSAVTPSLDCNVSQSEVTVDLSYGLSYSVVVSVVNAVGKGLPAIADIIVPELLQMCTVRHPSDDRRYVEAECSFNESILGYTAILYHSQLEHFVCSSTIASSNTIVMRGLINGLHHLVIFPLLKASNLVGRRLSFKTSITISDIKPEAVPIEYIHHNTESRTEAVASNYESQLLSSSFYQSHVLLYSIFGIIGLTGGFIIGTLMGLLSTACLYKWYWRKNTVT